MRRFFSLVPCVCISLRFIFCSSHVYIMCRFACIFFFFLRRRLQSFLNLGYLSYCYIHQVLLITWLDWAAASKLAALCLQALKKEFGARNAALLIKVPQQELFWFPFCFFSLHICILWTAILYGFFECVCLYSWFITCTPFLFPIP